MSARGPASFQRFTEDRAYDSPPADWMEDEEDIDLRLADMIWATPVGRPYGQPAGGLRPEPCKQVSALPGAHQAQGSMNIQRRTEHD